MNRLLVRALLAVALLGGLAQSASANGFGSFTIGFDFTFRFGFSQPQHYGYGHGGHGYSYPMVIGHGYQAPCYGDGYAAGGYAPAAPVYQHMAAPQTMQPVSYQGGGYNMPAYWYGR